MKKLAWRPMTPDSIVENLLMEIQATAMEGYDLSLEDQQREMFKRIVKTAVITQDVRRGLVTKSYEFNQNLLELLGEENLS